MTIEPLKRPIEPQSAIMRGIDRAAGSLRDGRVLLRRAEAIQARSDARRDGERVEDDHSCPSELAILHFAVAEPASSRAPEFRRRARPPRLP